MTEEYVQMYKDFCRDRECRIYSLLTKLNLIESPSPLVERQKEVIKVKCKVNCEHTTQEFYQWITKTNN